MKQTIILFAAAGLLLGAASASGATQQDRDGCKAEVVFIDRGTNAKIIVEACTRVLDDAASSRSDRIAALIRRCRIGVDRRIDCDEAGKLMSAAGATPQDRDGCKAELEFFSGQTIAEACTRVLYDAATSRSDRIEALIRRCHLGRDFFPVRDRRADCDEAIELDPTNANAYHFRARAWGDCDRAILDYSEAIRLDPRAQHSYLRRAECLGKKNELARAIADLTEALRLDPKFAQAYQDRSSLFWRLGEGERAVADDIQSIRLDADRARNAFQKSADENWKDRRELDAAVAHYSEAIKRNPRDTIAYHNRGLGWSAKRDLDRALGDFSEAIKIDPGFIAAYHTRAGVWFEKGDLERAILDRSAAMRADPTGQLLKETRQSASLVDQMRGSPNSAHPYWLRGKWLLEKRELDRAIADFTTGIERDPTHVDSHAARANAWFAKENYDQAIADYSRAITLAADQDNPARGGFGIPTYHLHFKRGKALHITGKYHLAVADYSELISGYGSYVTPLQESPYMYRGMAWSDLGDRARALTDYAEAGRRSPNDIPSMTTDGYDSFYRGRFKYAAVELAPAAYTMDDLQPMLFRYLARSRTGVKSEAELEDNAARKKGKDWAYAIVELYLGRASAATTLSAAAKPDDRCVAQFHIGQWHLLHGRMIEAKSALQIATDTCPKAFKEQIAAAAELKRLQP